MYCQFSKVLGEFGKVERKVLAAGWATTGMNMLMLMNSDRESVTKATNYRIIHGYLGIEVGWDTSDARNHILSGQNYVYLFDTLHEK